MYKRLTVYPDGQTIPKSFPYKRIATSTVEEHFAEQPKPKQGIIGIDTIHIDVPLMIRLLEYAREDARSDSDLHFIAERLVEASAFGNVLDMSYYDDIVAYYDDIEGPESEDSEDVE